MEVPGLQPAGAVSGGYWATKAQREKEGKGAWMGRRGPRASHFIFYLVRVMGCRARQERCGVASARERRNVASARERKDVANGRGRMSTYTTDRTRKRVRREWEKPQGQGQ